MNKYLFCFLLCCCGDEYYSPQVTINIQDIPDAPDKSFCGDGICDANRGEDSWWCKDCGFDIFTGGPKDGGFCGDGVCFQEDMISCYNDCRPIGINPTPEFDGIGPRPKEK